MDLVIIQYIYTTNLAPLLVQLPIMSHQKANIHQTQHRARNSDPKSCPERSRIICRFTLDENVARQKIRAIANAQYDCSSHGQARAAAQIVCQP